MTFINNAALNKIRRAASKRHSVMTKRCAFRRGAIVGVDSVDRRSSAGKLFQVSSNQYLSCAVSMILLRVCSRYDHRTAKVRQYGHVSTKLSPLRKKAGPPPVWTPKMLST